MSAKKKSKLPMGPIEMGEHFGYPSCCIAYFLGFMIAHIKGEKPPRLPRKLHGTGYIPCPDCNSKSEEELLATIVENRKEPLPFPRQSDDF